METLSKTDQSETDIVVPSTLQVLEQTLIAAAFERAQGQIDGLQDTAA